MIYRSHQSKYNYCTTCGTTLRVTNHRKCSNPRKIEEYLRKHTDFDGHILENDKVCHTCYKSHLIILQTSNCPSTDADLEQLINDLSKQLQFYSGKDVTDKAMNATALEVAKLLLENIVILLPTIKDVLMSYVHKYSTEHSTDITTTKQSITSRWILSHLTVNLKHHNLLHTSAQHASMAHWFTDKTQIL